MDESRLNFLKGQMESPYATVRESTWKFHGDVQPDYGIVDNKITEEKAKDLADINAANGIKPVSTSDNSFVDMVKNTNAYKKYFYSKDDVLLEAKKSARPQTFRKMPSWLTLIIWPTHAMYIIISRRLWTRRQCLMPTLS